MTFIQDLFDLQVPKDLKLSPDGSQVVYTTGLSWGHRKSEHVLSTIWTAETGEEHSAVQITSGQANDRYPRWMPDGMSIAFLSDRAKPGKSSAIYVLPLHGGEAYPITPVEHEQGIAKFELSPDGKSVAFVSPDEKTAEQKRKVDEGDDAQVWGEDWAYSRLRIVDVATKKVETVVSKDSHILDFVWSAHGKSIAFCETHDPDIESSSVHGTDISMLDIMSKESRTLCHLPNRAVQLTWAGDKLYFIASAVIEVHAGANAVWAIDLTSDMPTYEKYAYGDVNCTSEISRAGSTPTAMVQDGLEDQIKILGGKKLYGKTQRLETWDVALPSDSSEPILALATSDINTPNEVYTISPSTQKPIKLSNHGAVFRNRPIGSATFLHTRSLDKADDLDAVYLTPSGAPSKPLPTIVAVHGGPYMRMNDAFDTPYFYWTPVLLSAGYGVLLPNYRGGSSHGEVHAKYARGGTGRYDYDDVIALTQCAIEDGLADKEHLGVAGYSQGGFLSYLSAVRNGLHAFGWKFRCAVPGAGIADWDSLAQSSDVGCWEAEMSGAAPWNQHKEDVRERRGSALYELRAACEKGGVVPPVLMLHGEKDVRCPIEQARGFRRGLRFWGCEYEYVVYPREGHLFQEQKHVMDMIQRVVAFCDKHVK